MPDSSQTYSRRHLLKLSGVIGISGTAGCLDGFPGVGGSGSGIETWPLFQYDTVNSGSVPSATGLDGKVSERWTRDIGITAPPVAREGTLYVVTRGGASALSVDGSETWSTNFEKGFGPDIDSIALRDDLLYVRIEDVYPRLRVLATKDGAELAVDQGFMGGKQRLAVSDGSVFMAKEEPAVIQAVKTDDFEEPAWIFEDAVTPPEETWDNLPETLREALAQNELEGWEESNKKVWGEMEAHQRRSFLYNDYYNPYSATSPVVHDGAVYIAYERRSSIGRMYWKCYAISVTDGTKQWSARFPKDSTGPLDYFEEGANFSLASAELSVGEGRLFFPERTGAPIYPHETTLHALNTEDGTEEWRFDLPAPEFSPVTVGDGTVYIVNDARPDHEDIETATVYALSAQDGSEEWSYETDIHLGTSAFVLIGDTLYLTGVDRRFGERGRLVALSAGDGTEQWVYEMDKPIRTTPVVVKDTIYLGDREGVLHALSA